MSEQTTEEHEHDWHHIPSYPKGMLVCMSRGYGESMTRGCGESMTCEDHVWQDRKSWVRCKLCDVLKPCLDKCHGITCRDSTEGSGSYCRICGGEVPPEDVKPRTTLERLRTAINSLEQLCRDEPDMTVTISPSIEVLKREAEKITGKPEDRSPEAPKL